MVSPRKFTGTEWRALASGCRLLAMKYAESYEKTPNYSQSSGYLELKALHEELAELCEYWATQIDQHDHEMRQREHAAERAYEQGKNAVKKGRTPNVLRFKRRS
jgi:hypothetical protein